MPFAMTQTSTDAPTTLPGSANPSGGRLVTTDGRVLPLRGTELRANASAGLIRVVLRQRFVNEYDEPLRVTYQVPLPADAVVSGRERRPRLPEGYLALDRGNNPGHG